jgi:tripartite ATP-independent transporter DctM subunit
MMLATSAAVLVISLGLAVPIGIALMATAFILASMFAFLPAHVVSGEVGWSTSTSFLLVSIPFFVLLGEIFMRSGIASRMYEALSAWISWLPGGLMHSNIGACAMFAATSGSSVATAATIGTVAIPEMERHRYSSRLFLGTIVAGGTLGILIPPSINLIIYGAITNTSIPDLYLAAIIPGLLLAMLFSVIVLVLCSIVPAWGGTNAERASWRERINVLPDLIPPLVIFLVVIGSIYTGLATPTESAALGIVATLALALVYGRLTWSVLKESLENTVKITGQIMLIVIGAYILNFSITSIGLIREVTSLVNDAGLSPLQLLLVVVGIYLVLGMFLETLSMMVATVPIVAPVVIAAGFDAVWFGVLLMILIEAAMITPPVGINLFVVKGIHPKSSILDLALGATPFLLMMLVMVALLIAIPDLALWLPHLTK